MESKRRRRVCQAESFGAMVQDLLLRRVHQQVVPLAQHLLCVVVDTRLILRNPKSSIWMGHFLDILETHSTHAGHGVISGTMPPKWSRTYRWLHSFDGQLRACWWSGAFDRSVGRGTSTSRLEMRPDREPAYDDPPITPNARRDDRWLRDNHKDSLSNHAGCVPCTYPVVPPANWAPRAFDLDGRQHDSHPWRARPRSWPSCSCWERGSDRVGPKKRSCRMRWRRPRQRPPLLLPRVDGETWSGHAFQRRGDTLGIRCRADPGWERLMCLAEERVWRLRSWEWLLVLGRDHPQERGRS